MPASDQGISNGRYMIIPRTAIFLRRGDSYLLLKGAPTKKRWAGKYNGLGGHVERGEDVLASAQRELFEESGLEADIWLCGTVMVDVGETGVCMYVFTGAPLTGDLRASHEGTPEWITYEQVPSLPVVEDLPVLLARIHRMQRGDVPFSARSRYDADGRLVMTFAEPA
jgi:8-oxo-dGTP diphosphatase